MLKKLFSKTLSYLPQIVALLFILTFAAWAWTEPSQAPPGGNVPTPVNVGSDGQTKAGWLATLKSFFVGSEPSDAEKATTGILRTTGGAILNTGGAETGLIVQQGKVGIGTAEPKTKLDIWGDSMLGGDVYTLWTGPSDTVQFSSGGGTTNLVSYTKIKEMSLDAFRTPAGNSGVIRVCFDIATKDMYSATCRDDEGNEWQCCIEDSTPESTAFARIYKNDVSLGEERTSSASTLTTYCEDLTFSEFDKIQFFAKVNPDGDNGGICQDQAIVGNIFLKGEVQGVRGGPKVSGATSISGGIKIPTGLYGWCCNLNISTGNCPYKAVAKPPAYREGAITGLCSGNESATPIWCACPAGYSMVDTGYNIDGLCGGWHGRSYYISCYKQ